MNVNTPLRFFFPPLPVWLPRNDVTWRNRLRVAIARSGKKQSAIALEAGMAPETLSRILNATSAQPSFDTVVRIARALNENVGWLLDEHGFSLSAHEQRRVQTAVRILHDALLAQVAKPDTRHQPNAMPALAEIPRNFAAGGARLVYEASGDSMLGAGIADGDLLYVKPTRTMREANGHIVVCCVGGADYVRVLDVRAGRTRLLSRGEREPAMEVSEDELELIGIVVGRTGPVA